MAQPTRIRVWNDHASYQREQWYLNAGWNQDKRKRTASDWGRVKRWYVFYRRRRAAREDGLRLPGLTVAEWQRAIEMRETLKTPRPPLSPYYGPFPPHLGALVGANSRPDEGLEWREDRP